MAEIIGWCNTNNGFLTGILSIVGLLLSTIAIAISIHTARLPYKKKVKLGSSTLIGAAMGGGLCTSPAVIGFAASVTNVGNRTVYMTYIGYAIKANGKYNKIYPINRDFDCKAMLGPSEYKDVQFMTNELAQSFSKLDRRTKLYVYASDSEGKEYLRKVGTVGELLDNLKAL